MTVMEPVVHQILRGAVRILFFLSSTHKTGDFAGFKRTLAAYGVVPAGLEPPVAVIVIVAEAAVTLLDQTALAGLLLVAYAALIATNLLRGRDRIDCGCVGVAGRNGLSWWLVGRNLVCAAGAFAVPSRLAPLHTLPWIDMFTVVGGIATLAAMYVATDQLIANAATIRRLREAA